MYSAGKTTSAGRSGSPWGTGGGKSERRSLTQAARAARGTAPAAAASTTSTVSAPSGSSVAGGSQSSPLTLANNTAHSNAVRLLPSGRAWLLAGYSAHARAWGVLGVWWSCILIVVGCCLL